MECEKFEPIADITCSMECISTIEISDCSERKYLLKNTKDNKIDRDKDD